VKIEVDAVTVFEHPRFNELDNIEVGTDAAQYDLEKYFLPPVIRKILKTTKTQEVFQVTSTRKDKVAPYFEDPNGIFKKEVLENFKKSVIFTVNLIAFE
jgi:hypothetical protein